MDRIKNLEEVKVQGGNLWCEVIIKDKPKSIIIDPNKPVDIDYIVVKSVGEHVKDVNAGDVILEFIGEYGLQNTYPLAGKHYANIARNVCKLIVSSDNFKVK